MRVSSKIKTLHWLKRNYRINIKAVKSKLEARDFDALVTLIHQLREIGSVYDPNKVIEEYLEEYGKEYLPQTYHGTKIESEYFHNTHPQDEEGFIHLDLKHLLLGSWCRPSRENVRALTKHLKGLGYQIKRETPTYSMSPRVVVHLKTNYDLQLPPTLKVYKKPIEFQNMLKWTMENLAPKVTLMEEEYQIRPLNDFWSASFNARLRQLFTSGNVPHIHRHPKHNDPQRPDKYGVYETAPPVIMLCELVIRDIFKEASISKWVHLALIHEEGLAPIYTSPETSDTHKELFLQTIVDEVEGYLKDTLIDGVSPQEVRGWVCVLVLSYVKDTLKRYGKET